MFKSIPFCLLLLTLLTFSCKQKKEPVGLGTIIQPKIGVNYIDTFSVDLSTVLLDSLPTSNSSRLLVGRLENNDIGDITASSFFSLSLAGNDSDGDGREDILINTNNPVYDKLVLYLDHDYSYGDTTTIQSLYVYRLTQKLANVSGTQNIYNSSSFSYDPSPIGSGSISYTYDTDTISAISISDQLGKEIFDLAKNGDFRVSTNQLFQDYFKGIALVPSASNKSAYGLALNPVLRLYYHDEENPYDVKYYDFVYKTNSDIHYNKISNNRSSSPINNLKDLLQEVPSTQTNNESYLMTGIELLPKIKFPTLNNIKARYPNSIVNYAQLVIRPKANSYSPMNPLPDRLILYATGNDNKTDSLICYSNTTNPEVISPTVDWENSDNTNYTFEVTDIMIKQLQADQYNGMGLMLASIRSESNSRLEKLVLENNQNLKYSIKLKLYLTIY